VSERTATIIFALFTVVLLAFVGLNWVGSLLGDCMEGDQACFAYKEYGPPLVLWRGAAIQLAVSLLYVLHRKA